MRNKKNVAFAITLSIAMATSFAACSDTSDKANESNQTTQNAENNVSMDLESNNADSTSTGIENTDYSEENTTVIEDVHDAQGIVVQRETEPGQTDTTYFEILRIERIDDETSFSYVSEESEKGQYDVLNYTICGNSILITEKDTLHVFDLTSETEIATVSLSSNYNGAAVADSQYAYFMNADGGEVMKADSMGELLWEIDNSDASHAGADLGGGSSIEFTDNGNLKCSYEFGNCSAIVISQEDGSFVEKME